VGGDVDPNHMDAVVVVSMSKWVVAELVRVFHGTDTATASSIVEGLVEREIPLVWEVGNGVKRVLDTSMTMKQRTSAVVWARRTRGRHRLGGLGGAFESFGLSAGRTSESA
jgi:hypothetical protein